jgi:hypothetical protein
LLLFLTLPAGVRTYHYSFWSDDSQRYLYAVKKYSSGTPLEFAPGEAIRAGIVTHHFLARALMVRFFETLRANCSPDTIILLGPNHYHHGSANISLSSLPWKTPFGVLEADQPIVQQFKHATGLLEDREAFTGEHSIGVLVPFLKYYFPHSRVVPVLVDANVRESNLKELRGALSELLGKPQILVLLSMDFSHHSIASIADCRDAQAEKVISALDLDRVGGLNVDCHRGLWLLLASLKDQGQVKVRISEHSNSARLTGHSRQPDVTSYFTVYFLR